MWREMVGVPVVPVSAVWQGTLCLASKHYDGTRSHMSTIRVLYTAVPEPSPRSPPSSPKDISVLRDSTRGDLPQVHLCDARLR